nr:MAG TPA: hypothetical protein [Bacteriophage sp.]
MNSKRKIRKFEKKSKKNFRLDLFAIKYRTVKNITNHSARNSTPI